MSVLPPRLPALRESASPSLVYGEPTQRWSIAGGLEYSLRSNRKTTEDKQHKDRDVQFQHINKTVEQFQQRQQPVISVDAKKKALLGEYKNAGVEWQPKGEPTPVKQQ